MVDDKEYSALLSGIASGGGLFIWIEYIHL